MVQSAQSLYQSRRLNQFSRLRKIGSVSIVGLCVALAAVRVGADDHHDHSVPPVRNPAEMYAPSVTPDRVVLSWTGDPTTSMALTWRTSTAIARAYAQVAIAGPGPNFPKQANKHTAKTELFESDLSKAHQHSVVVTGLKPGTKYAYRVGDDVNWSEWFQFRTAAAEAEPFHFVYFGDSQNDVRSMWSRVIREAFADAPRAAFMLHAGDLVNRATSDAEWGEWFHAGAFINAHIPVVAIPGNHEYTRRKVLGISTTRMLTPNWRPTFTFPENGPKGLEETTYYIDYQNIRLVALNSNEQADEQAEWLDRVLTESKQTWNILTFHHPIYSMAKRRDNPDLREQWKPIIDKHKVDLVLTGHDHTYGRSNLIAPEKNVPDGVNWRSEKGGTVYVVSVSGPKMYEVDEKARERMEKSGEQKQLYQIIHIDGKTLKYIARTADGVDFDSFTLNKSTDGVNTLEN